MSTHIALVQVAGSQYASQAATGIHRFARERRGDWHVVDFGLIPTTAFATELTRWQPDGIITCCEHVDSSVVQQLQSFDCPVVDMAGRGQCSVSVSAKSVASLAAAHFAERNGMQIACFGVGAELAGRSIAEHLQSAAATQQDLPEFFLQASYVDLVAAHPEVPPELREWLAGLAKPAGVLCDSDLAAAYLLRCCEQLGISVPDTVAILGCGDEPLCRITDPEISSIRVPTERIGYEAARLLAGILATGRRSEHLTLDAIEVAPRASSKPEMMDPTIVQALDFIAERAPGGITVADVMETQDVSRVTFERRFKAVTGRSPGAEIRRVRLEHVKKLLTETDMTAADIARQAGFDNGANLSLFFKKATQMTPIAYRRQQREIHN